MISLRCVLLAALLACMGAQASSLDSRLSTPSNKSTKPVGQSIPEVRSNAALVIDSSNAAVLFARNADQPRPIASLTKLMTALVVLAGEQPLNELIVMTREDRSGTEGTPSRLQAGAKLTRGDLLQLALMSSDNRAAYALGRTYPGGTEALVRAMNAKAIALGMTQARFADASGLSSANVASAADIAKLVMAVAESDAIRRYSTAHNHSITLAKHALEFRNTNYLVTKPDWDIHVQKTGYTSAAGQCLVMKTVIQGRSVVIVLLDSFGKYTRTADARRIRKWLEAQTVTLARAAR